MNPRQETILNLIVQAYVETAEPVSSQQLCDQHGLTFSSATVRNDMAVLEAEGYIHQPHTSAGRIPTELGYRHYITQMKAKPTRLAVTFRVTVRAKVTSEEHMLSIGHELAKATGEAVLLSTSRPWSSVIGLANLLRKPDFRSQEMVLALAGEIEAIDRELLALAHAAPDEVTVWLGREGPFGTHLATVVTRCDLPNNQEGCLAIVGPQRMNYERNIALLTRAKELLQAV